HGDRLVPAVLQEPAEPGGGLVEQVADDGVLVNLERGHGVRRPATGALEEGVWIADAHRHHRTRRWQVRLGPHWTGGIGEAVSGCNADEIHAVVAGELLNLGGQGAV